MSNSVMSPAVSYVGAGVAEPDGDDLAFVRPCWPVRAWSPSWASRPQSWLLERLVGCDAVAAALESCGHVDVQRRNLPGDVTVKVVRGSIRCPSSPERAARQVAARNSTCGVSGTASGQWPGVVSAWAAVTTSARARVAIRTASSTDGHASATRISTLGIRVTQAAYTGGCGRSCSGEGAMGGA
jgi:hypothetical protein